MGEIEDFDPDTPDIPTVSIGKVQSTKAEIKWVCRSADEGDVSKYTMQYRAKPKRSKKRRKGTLAEMEEEKEKAGKRCPIAFVPFLALR